jgi:hypothetical protein
MRFDPAQDVAANLGNVVPVNPDGSIPPDNPFVGKSGAQADIASNGDHFGGSPILIIRSDFAAP